MDWSADLDFDWAGDLDFDAAPVGDPRYPADLQHPVLVWDDQEEDLQGAALSWLLQWRVKNPFTLGTGNTSKFRDRPESELLWKAHGEKMADWAWLEKGGLNLVAMEKLMLKRHAIRVSLRPPYNPNAPVCAGALKEK
jgi:hypothetical protein